MSLVKSRRSYAVFVYWESYINSANLLRHSSPLEGTNSLTFFISSSFPILITMKFTAIYIASAAISGSLAAPSFLGSIESGFDNLKHDLQNATLSGVANTVAQSVENPELTLGTFYLPIIMNAVLTDSGRSCQRCHLLVFITSNVG